MAVRDAVSTLGCYRPWLGLVQQLRVRHASAIVAVRTWIGLGLLALLASLTWLLAASPAGAHTSLIESSPADQATIEQEPARLSLSFDEPLGQPAFIVVTAPDGTTATTAEPEISGNRVSAQVESTGLAGDYTFAFRVVSADGHTFTDELSYTVLSGRTVSPGTVPEQDSSTWLMRGSQVPHFVLAAMGGLGALFVLYGPSRRRRG